LLFVATLLTALSTAPSGSAAAGEPIGVVRNVSGNVSVVRQDRLLPAAPGTQLYVGDALATGPASAVGAVLRDDSTVSLGAESRIVFRDFAFAPAQGRFALVVGIAAGTMAYLSGLIGKLAPEAARFETPVASIGIRGTRFAVKVGQPSPR
jgi:hypothetical protein